MRPAKVQVSLRMRTVKSDSLLGALVIAKNPRTLQTDTKDYINPFMSSGIFYLISLERSISYIRGAWLVFFNIIMFCRNF